ncbi:sensor histidine kinase [Nonomuraea soli]|uniref:histidine kinase n=1 Tax=Nonomuraea soli TaxID=1032476 RepID=A0A7W0CMZ1_9ACTN|nr:histidine kinase [Nonomuraea soli]MBA2894014.1 signal transduction histidine kinase [Nonomuraea soli]
MNRWVEWARRIAAAPRAPVVAGVLLVLLAVAESLLDARDTRLPSLVGGISETVPVGTITPAVSPHPPDNALYFLVFPLLALAATLPLLLLRALPGAVIVTATVVVSLTAFHTLTLAAAAALLISEYRLGRRGSPLAAVVLAAPFPVLALVMAASEPSGEGSLAVLVLASMAPTAALAGIAQRAHAQTLASAATRQVVEDSLLAHTARGERARIARELHDVVAHHISMVAVQAETARLATPGMPDAGAERLLAIGNTARAALTEMRRVLGVLREDAEAETAERRPQPGLRLHELNALLDEAREASGTVVRLVLSGTPEVFDPGVELAAYRIVQEALTNARRHAPGAAVDVELAYSAEALRVRVRDNGPGTAQGARRSVGGGDVDEWLLADRTHDGADGGAYGRAGGGTHGGGPGGRTGGPGGGRRDGTRGGGLGGSYGRTGGGRLAGAAWAGVRGGGQEEAGGWGRFLGRRRASLIVETPVLPVAGHGLSGMKERVAAVGGRFRAGAAPGGGFMVEAILPRAAE